MSKIEWTEATWNPVVGCSLASPGCTNCYAMKMAGRIEATGHPSYQGLTRRTKAGFAWTGELALNEKALLEPLRRRKPTVYFVNSMGDLFHEDCPDDWIDRVFAVMALAPQHTFQVLTKRSARMREYLNDHALAERIFFATGEGPSVTQVFLRRVVESRLGKFKERWPLSNVWLGVSVEDQTRADERVPDLLATPAAVRWLSCEPLLGPVDLSRVAMVDADGESMVLDALRGNRWWVESGSQIGIPAGQQGWDGRKGCWRLDWIVAGGESGPGARPMHPGWARTIRDQCEASETPFFFKQWGDWEQLSDDSPEGAEVADLMPNGLRAVHANRLTTAMARVGKRRAGRLLDGVLHDAMPVPA